MKTLKAFRLSDEAVAILDKQDNSTQFIENLILGNRSDDKVSFTEMYDVLTELFDSYLNKPQILGETVQPPTPAEQELLDSLPVTPACCLSSTPCRHWVWAPDKIAYVNSITGELRDPDV